MYAYVMVYSSFYKAAYAQEKLSGAGIRSGIMRVPPGVISSCGYGIYLKEKDLNAAKKVLKEAGITWIGIFRIERRDGQQDYVRI